MNENQGPQKNKRKTCAAEPSRAEQQRGGNVSELFVCCSVLFSEVSFWSDVWGQTVPEVTTRFYNTSQLKMMWTGAGFMSHSAVQLVTSRHRLTQKHSEESETTPPAVTERFCWFCSGFWTLKTRFCWTLLFFVNLTCDETTKQILLTESSLRLCNMKTRRNKSCWFYSHSHSCDFSLVLDWFWFFFTDKHS